MPWICDMHSVGVLVSRTTPTGSREYLVFTRVGVPSGVAPVAGHVFDSHDGPRQAAQAELTEETSLTAAPEQLNLVAMGWRPNRCGAPLPDQAAGEGGHFWWIYQVTEVTGELNLAPDEARDARWAPVAELQTLADRAAAYAAGDLSEEQWQQQPGLEPVWCYWLQDLGLISLTGTEQARIARIAATPPVPTPG